MYIASECISTYGAEPAPGPQTGSGSGSRETGAVKCTISEMNGKHVGPDMV